MRAQKRVITAALGLLAAAVCGAPAAAQEPNVSYRSSQRDPFSNFKVQFKRKIEKKDPPKPQPMAPPNIESRIDQYKAQKRAAVNLQQPAPKPTTALLLKEVEVTGIFRTPRGYAAMVQATPINLSYVIYPGEPFYDGMLVAIEDSRLVFRRETQWTDGRRDVAVETKPLKQPTAADALTQKPAEPAKDAPAPAPAAPARRDDKVIASRDN